MLAFSSLSRNSRYVGAMWLGLWLVGDLASGVLTRTVRADWCPLVSYTSNLHRVRDALLDAETSWDKVTNLFQAGRQPDRPGERSGSGHDPFARRAGVPVAARLRRSGQDSQAAPAPAHRARERSSRGHRRPRRTSVIPATWSAGRSWPASALLSVWHPAQPSVRSLDPDLR